MEIKRNPPILSEPISGMQPDTDASAAETPQTGAPDSIEDASMPGFVSNLLEGTFQGVVDSSIQQMDDYGNLLKNLTNDSSQQIGTLLPDDDHKRKP